MYQESIALPPALQELLAYYIGKIADGCAPTRGDAFSPNALRPWLGSVALISCQERDYFCRLMGTRLLSRFGVELTGKRFSEIDSRVLGDLPERTRRCVSLGSQVVGRAASHDGRVTFAELLLPLAGPGGEIDTILLASYPAAPDGRSGGS